MLERRRRMITELWTEDGRHFLQPPQEIRAIAAQPGVAMTAILEARGYEEIEARVASAYEHWVGSEGLSFRGRDDAEQLADVVKFHWEAVDKDGEVFGVGLTFLLLAADGRHRARLERVRRRLSGPPDPGAVSSAFSPVSHGPFRGRPI